MIITNDLSNGIISAKGYIDNIAQHSSLTSSSKINGTVILQTTIEDEKVTVKSTIVSYEMEMQQGVLGNLAGTSYSIWLPTKSFPYFGKKYKVTASKALVNCHIWSKLMTDNMVQNIDHHK